MKKLLGAILLTLLFVVTSFPQSKPVMYFCERYDAQYGEIGVSSAFTKGSLTVMVKSNSVISYDPYVTIQIDRYNPKYDEYRYYASIPFEIPEASYIYFSHKDLRFDHTGFYRVFLLDSNGKTITMATLEIIQ